MFRLSLIFRNARRHTLRTTLTALGIVVAILSFGLLQTVVDAWYAGANNAAPTRLITRNAISLTFSMPISYRDKIRAVDGVRSVSYANWFGGIYQDPRNFFPQFAVDAVSYLQLYPEYLIAEDDKRAFLHDRRGCIVGRKLANSYGFKVGDVIPLKGTIYPGNWEFVVRAIYDGADAKTDTSQLLFHWTYLNETVKQRSKARGDAVGVFVVDAASVDRVAEIAQAVDAVFKNSLAETLTETERAFQIGFVKQTEAILIAIRIVSFVVIIIILAVMANTMAMTARERLPEYATLKALGFSPSYVGSLIFGESMAIALVGGALGVALTFPFAKSLGELFARFLPVFEVSMATVWMQIAAALIVGIVSALVPVHRAAGVRIVDGLRAIA